MQELPTEERFRPKSHAPPDSFMSRMVFSVRLLVDFQLNTIYRDLKARMPMFTGKVLDIGCGGSPFRHLLNESSGAAEYHGIDVEAADAFDYHRTDIQYFDGDTIPFDDATFKHFICTEVLEHVAVPTTLIHEMYRVLEPGGVGIVTLPWSARFHYQPYDYHRYTPTMLKQLFAEFDTVAVLARGSDVTVIGNKSLVAYVGMIDALTSLITRPSFSQFALLPLRVIAALVCFPFVVVAVVLAQISLLVPIGSDDDPLGYTILVTKK
jgi:SAM-dependent methyltransferase